MATNIASSVHTATRKTSQCDCCGLIIHIGQKYEKTMVSDWGDVWFHKAHIECNELASEMHSYFEMECDEGFSQTEYLEALNEVCRDHKVKPHPDTKKKLILAVRQIFKLGSNEQ